MFKNELFNMIVIPANFFTVNIQKSVRRLSERHSVIFLVIVSSAQPLDVAPSNLADA